LVHSTRGKRGGFSLARRPESISVADVVRAIEAEEPIYDCLRNSRGCQGNSDCLLRGMFQRVERVMYQVMEETSLADLLQSPQAARRVRWLGSDRA
jgi:Rrf2 family nitric oxide-sensitive transcriptional repressor